MIITELSRLVSFRIKTYMEHIWSSIYTKPMKGHFFALLLFKPNVMSWYIELITQYLDFITWYIDFITRYIDFRTRYIELWTQYIEVSAQYIEKRNSIYREKKLNISSFDFTTQYIELWTQYIELSTRSNELWQFNILTWQLIISSCQLYKIVITRNTGY